MSYSDEKFWKQYKKYIDESFNRHKNVISLFEPLIFDDHHIYQGCANIIDLGCGRFKEARDLIGNSTYLGVDTEPANIAGLNRSYRTDYRNIDLIIKLANEAKSDIFTSLFSMELTDTQIANYNYYDRLFEECPSIRCGVVAGIYYGNKREDQVVHETGDVTSFQSTLDIVDTNPKNFIEYRLQCKAPSKMFGGDVVEVWKLFTRKH